MANIYGKTNRVSSENSMHAAIQENTPTSTRVKIVIIMTLPILGVVIYSSVHLHGAITLSNVAEVMRGKIALNQEIHRIVNKLQNERGRTAVFFGNVSDYNLVLDRYKNSKNATDLTVDKATITSKHVIKKILISKKELELQIKEIRESCFQFKVTLEMCLNNYTGLIQRMLKFATRILVGDNNDICLNSVVISNAAVLYGLDAIGLQRALGSLFYLECKITHERFEWFLLLRGESETYLKSAFHYDDIAAKMYVHSIGNNTLIRNTDNLLENVTPDVCESLAHEEKLARSLQWFDAITNNMDALIGIESNQAVRIMTSFDSKSEQATHEVTLYVSTLVVATLACAGISIWYSWSVTKMTKKIKNYAHELSARSAQLREEKIKTESLLFRMLPPDVAEKLKNNQSVPPEHYENCTIFFSDIVGFTLLSSRSSPYEIVALLNSLYCLFDNCIDRHDVYKVETIGDAYMVVSGVPIRNGINHVSEVADLSLSLRSLLGNFIIPHMESETLQMRIGVHSGTNVLKNYQKEQAEIRTDKQALHLMILAGNHGNGKTGPVVAGIVGTKMPRYCLFGNTVNVASRMESTSEAMKIQISEDTHKMLKSFGRYDTTPRGSNNIKGKGVMCTYWLHGTR